LLHEGQCAAKLPEFDTECDVGHRPENSKVCKKNASDRARVAGKTESDRPERQMRYLVNVANERPMLRISATIVLAFTCAAPFVLLFSDLVAHGVHALIQ
jgi:hypothetical protein